MVEIRTEVAGSVWKIVAESGTPVAEGDAILIIESMKMEIPIEAPRAGTIARLCVAEGESVAEGTLVALLG
jgi:acetyl-CoA carboxylase biotin carboxyl carrier protein